jgi:hypothetical protein
MLDGGPDPDTFKGLNGNDTLYAQDSGADTEIDCDGGTTPGTADIAHTDGSDPASSGCESLNPATGYARPLSATPVTVRLVPAFNQCTGGNSTHAAPLSSPSCNPPVQSSSHLTFNAPDRASPFNTTADGAGYVIFKVTCLSSTNPPVENGQSPPCTGTAGDQADVKITTSLDNVRCLGSPGQQNCAAGAGSLYGGKVLVQSTLRITDRLNGPSLTAPATAADVPLSVGLQCSSGACSTTTSADAVYPGVTLEQKRAIWQLGQLKVFDGGSDGALVAAPAPASGACPPACAGNGGETEFLRQGLFVP